jgi:hypothetical protein
MGGKWNFIRAPLKSNNSLHAVRNSSSWTHQFCECCFISCTVDHCRNVCALVCVVSRKIVYLFSRPLGAIEANPLHGSARLRAAASEVGAGESAFAGLWLASMQTLRSNNRHMFMRPQLIR